ncbi:MAG: S-layer homology domain-containing protein, partial [Defluviitaleaceae bacterium]|nr:S-layer homology domain-containing protein [Defluviitaleaceae bacterium]
ADTVDPNVEKAAYLGIVTGTGGGNFSPNIPFSREQAAVIISRLMYAIGEPLPEAAPTFGDTDRISAWARDSVGQVQAAGIMSGTGQNLFTPHGTFTRQESIFVTWRLFTLLT